MPLSRIQLRNEYGFGVRELYSESSKREDPKAVLEGVAVAGVVGLLRQVGELTEFAAEIFHGLQEQMATTASRSRKLMARMKHVETALPRLEKAMLSQTSHLHFAYTPGSDWHSRIRNEQNHFIYTDLPHCIMDTYEECREPPCLQLLDKFDAGGPGSCLKRYSDPTFFRRVSGNNDILNDNKSKKERKACKVKKRRSWKRSSQLLYDASNFDASGRVQFSSPSRQQQSSPTTVSTFDTTFKPDLVDQSDSLGSGNGMVFVECDLIVNNGNPKSSILEKNGHCSSGVTWDEKVEIVEPMVLSSGRKEIPSLHETSFEFGGQEIEPIVLKSGNDEIQEVQEGTFQLDEPDTEPKGWNCRSYDVPEVQESNVKVDDVDMEPVHQISGSKEMAEVHEKNFEFDDREIEALGQVSGHHGNLQHYEQEMEPEIDRSLNVHTSFDGMESPNVTLDKNQPDQIESETDNFVDALNTIESESETDLDCQTKGEICSHRKDDLQDVVDNGQMESNTDVHSLVSVSASTSYDDLDKQKFSIHVSTSSLLPACEESLPHIPASRDISGREPCENPDNLVFSVHSVEDTALQSIQSSSLQDVSSGNDFIVHDANSDGSLQVGEFSSYEFEPTRMIGGIDVGFICFPCASEQPSVKSSNGGSNAFWTNGGLLGLQPSKRPDFSTSNGVNINNRTTVGPLYQNLKPEDDHLRGKLDSSSNDSTCDYGNTNSGEPIFSGNHEIDSSKLPLQFSNFGLERKLNNSLDSELSSRSANSQSQLLPTVVHPEAKSHVSANVQDTLNEAIIVNEKKSSFLSGLGYGLLVNGFQRTRSMEYAEKPKEGGYRRSHDVENGPHVTLHRFLSGSNLTEELSSPLKSAPPSPPIEHMKISFHPINSFEASKLKLKFPEGIEYHSETSDAYPSFQMVPELILQHDIVSDSDDDTFCRSNLCMPDDDLSHLSDSNSELWESGESLSSSTEQMRNTSIHNGFGSRQVQDRKGVALASSSPLPEIPLMQAMNPFGFQETKISYNPNASMEPFDILQLTPEPPPLPPLQWRVPKPQSNAFEGKESTLHFISSFSDSMNRGSVYSHITKPAAHELINNRSELMNVAVRNKHFDEQTLKVNVQEKISQASKGRRVDEREDFMHQIRTKSFNLRKTGLLKPTPTLAAPAAHVNVTAILEKANAIRQAVASDDGEDDDPWSDT